MSKLEAQAPGYLSIKLSLRIWFKAIAQPFLSSYNELAEIRTKPLQAYVWIVGSGLITGLIIFLLNWGIGVKKQLPINSTDLRNIFLDPLFALILFSSFRRLNSFGCKNIGWKRHIRKICVSCFLFLCTLGRYSRCLIHIYLWIICYLDTILYSHTLSLYFVRSCCKSCTWIFIFKIIFYYLRALSCW
jgi:hypothetical protein